MTMTTAQLRALTAILALVYTKAEQSCSASDDTCIDTGRYKTWEESPASWDEFGHDNDRTICRLPIISVAEWEEGQYWLKQEPVIVKNVTEGWGAREHWTKEEMIRRYPDIMVGMGSAKELGQVGPDDRDLLQQVSIKDFIVNHMHDEDKYVFDRKLKMPDNLMEDVEPYPMPSRHYKEDYQGYMNLGLPGREMWMDHLAITIGRDLQGLTFHRHNAAWNAVVFGAKRWILYDGTRFEHNITRLKRMTRDVNNPIQLTGPQWIKTLYHKNERMDEIRTYGHDCIQHAGDMIYVPDQWAHMVVNIGDTVAIVSERGLKDYSARSDDSSTYKIGEN